MKGVSWLLFSFLCLLILCNKSTFCTLFFERDVINAMDELAWPPSIVEKHILSGLVNVVSLLHTYCFICFLFFVQVITFGHKIKNQSYLFVYQKIGILSTTYFFPMSSTISSPKLTAIFKHHYISPTIFLYVM